ncbi:MAG: aspartate aminotransferase family protein [Candidatus Methylomirabilales bacterium]
MSDPLHRPTGIETAYRHAHPTSAKLFDQACQVIPGGITHDIRHLEPFPLYVERARGTRKWAVDGQELIDYWMGHGALFLGHLHPTVMQAVREETEKGTHLGACHPLEVRWAELVRQMVPSAERVRFTGSGTEATQLALRLARAFAGKDRVLKLEGHFHGWHDYAVAGVKPPYAAPVSRGIPQGTLGQVVLVPPNDLGAVERVLGEDAGIGAVILEPAGGTSGTIPTDRTFLAGLRALTARAGVVLIFDEVISGFRCAPGGAQEAYGVTADLTTLAKILAGGLPGGAVVGRAEIMDLIAFRDDPEWNRHRRVAHAGTFNANPLSAAAGIATLELIKDGKAHRRANRAGELMRAGMQEAVERTRADAWVYGEASIFNIFLGPSRLGLRPDAVSRMDHRALQQQNLHLHHQLRLGTILNGVDIPPFHGWISSVHSDEDIEGTVAAFEKSLRMLQEEGLLD